MALAKIFRFVDGSVTNEYDIVISQNVLNPLSKKLEKDATEFEYSDVSLTIHHLSSDFFSDYSKSVYYFMEIQDGPDDWDGSRNNPIFFGLINRKGIKYDEPSLLTTVQVLSLDNLLETSPDINARGVYLTALRDTFSGALMGYSESGVELGKDDNTGRLTMPAPVVWNGDGIDDYLSAGSTFVMKASYDFGEVEYRAVVIDELINPDPDEKTILTDIFDIGRVEKYFDPQPDGTNEYYVTTGSPGYIEINNPKLVRNVQQFVGGWITFFEPSGGNYDSYAYKIDAATIRSFESSGEIRELLRLEVTPEGTATMGDIFSNSLEFTIVPKVLVEPDTEVRLLSKEIYGVWQLLESDTIDAWITLNAMVNLVPVLNDLNPEVLLNGDPIKISRLFSFDPNPAKAFNQILRNSNTLCNIYAGARKSNGLRSVVFELNSRDEMMERTPVKIPVPLTNITNVATDKPIVIVKGTRPMNVATGANESYGWYSEDDDGNPNYSLFAQNIPSGGNIITVNLDLTEPGDIAFYDGSINDYYYNDDKLREIAEAYYRFYGTYYKPDEMVIQGVHDNILGYPVTNDEYHPFTGIVLAVEPNYVRRETKLQLRLSD